MKTVINQLTIEHTQFLIKSFCYEFNLSACNNKMDGINLKGKQSKSNK